MKAVGVVMVVLVLSACGSDPNFQHPPSYHSPLSAEMQEHRMRVILQNQELILEGLDDIKKKLNDKATEEAGNRFWAGYLEKAYPPWRGIP